MYSGDPPPVFNLAVCESQAMINPQVARPSTSTAAGSTRSRAWGGCHQVRRSGAAGSAGKIRFGTDPPDSGHVQRPRVRLL